MGKRRQDAAGQNKIRGNPHDPRHPCAIGVAAAFEAVQGENVTFFEKVTFCVSRGLVRPRWESGARTPQAKDLIPTLCVGMKRGRSASVAGEKMLAGHRTQSVRGCLPTQERGKEGKRYLFRLFLL